MLDVMLSGYGGAIIWGSAEVYLAQYDIYISNFDIIEKLNKERVDSSMRSVFLCAILEMVNFLQLSLIFRYSELVSNPKLKNLLKLVYLSS